MNPKALVLFLAIACLAVSGVLIMGDDGVADDATRETDGGDQIFEWPSVSDSTKGTVQLKEFGEEQVSFFAVANHGCRFVHWIGSDGLIVLDNPVAIPIAETGAWTAVFEEESA